MSDRIFKIFVPSFARKWRIILTFASNAPRWPNTPVSEQMILQVQQLSKQYKHQPAVDQISFSVEKGEIVGFLGPNGAGKSTALKMITGCLSIDKGDVFIGNHSIVADPLRAKALIGYLPEHNALYEEMYVREYLEYVAGFYKLSGEKRQIVKNIMENTGLSPESHKKIGQLSRGYRQRVGLAQALIHRPELLVLDEPFTGLDPNQIEEIITFVKRESADKAILFSSHVLQEVSSVCTRVIILHHGRIVLDKPSGEIENLALTFKRLTQ